MSDDNTVHDVGLDEAIAMFDAGATLLDVNAVPSEIANMALCRSGNRSSKAAAAHLGHSNEAITQQYYIHKAKPAPDLRPHLEISGPRHEP